MSTREREPSDGVIVAVAAAVAEATLRDPKKLRADDYAVADDIIECLRRSGWQVARAGTVSCQF